MSANSLTEMMERAKQSDSFWIEGLILEITEEILYRMKTLRVSKGELAKRLGIGPSMVSKLISGENNFQLDTLVKIARRLDSEVRIHLQPDGTFSEWVDIVPCPVRTATLQVLSEGAFRCITSQRSDLNSNNIVSAEFHQRSTGADQLQTEGYTPALAS